MSDIPQRVQSIRRRIDQALARSHLGTRPVTLIAVTKYHPAAMVETVARAGVTDVGESRVQVSRPKWTRSSHPCAGT